MSQPVRELYLMAVSKYVSWNPKETSIAKIFLKDYKMVPEGHIRTCLNLLDKLILLITQEG